MLFVNAAAGVVLTAAVLWCAYAVACRVFADAPASTRLTAAAVLMFWLLTAAFLLLSAVRLFMAPVSIAGWVCGAALAHRWARRTDDPRARLAADRVAIGEWWRLIGAPLRILIGIGAAVVTARLVHGLLAPCLTWDALTYHLYRPAVWVQSNGFVSTSGPDASSYYTWFPVYGDAVWGWWLQAMHGDVAISPVAVGMWLMVPMATYACVRTMGADPVRATAAAAALAFMPAVIVLSAVVYNDNLTLALYLAATLFLMRFLTTRGRADGLCAVAAMAVLVGVKGGLVLPAYALAVAVVVVLAPSVSTRLAALAIAVPGVIPALSSWIVMGSPVYPLTVRLGGHLLFPGNVLLEQLLYAGWMTNDWAADAAARVFARMFYPWVRMNADFLNLGLGPLIVLPVAIPGVIVACRSKANRAGVAFLLLGALLTIASIAGGPNRGLILWWWGLMGRLVDIAAAAVVVYAAAFPSRVSTWLLAVAAAAGALVSWPRGLSEVDLVAARYVLPGLAAVAVGVWLAGRVLPRLRLPLYAGGLIVALTLFIDARDAFRYPFYHAAAAWQAYDVHPIDNRWTASWPIWQRLDQDRPLTVAVTAGWDGIGHNWYRYPLLGRRLQNRLIYLPITADGRIIDYGGPPPDVALSCDAWLARVLDSPADYLVVLPPMPPESEWPTHLPTVFTNEARIPLFDARLYSIHRGARRPTCAPTPAGS